MAGISIAEKRFPQDGSIQIKIGVKKINLRVSTIPTIYGESIVMRILDQDGLLRGLSDLGLFDDDQVVFNRFISLPDGLILLTGPTGSGKTTTLYSSLHYLNHPDRKNYNDRRSGRISIKWNQPGADFKFSRFKFCRRFTRDTSSGTQYHHDWRNP